MDMNDTIRIPEDKPLDVAVVGAGFAGLYLLHCLREAGFSAIAFETADDVGGTWFWNRYPGARCDVESVEYQLGFPSFLQREWTWTERYASQGEIERYLRFVADRLDLRRDIRFRQRVVSAHFGADLRWTVETAQGMRVRAQYCVMATGCLSAAQLPNIPGLAKFEGEILHTGEWPTREPDFSSKRVAVIGTGSSAVQAIPLLAARSQHLYVFQRTPNFVYPVQSWPLKKADIARAKEQFPASRAEAQMHPFGGMLPLNGKLADEMNEGEREIALERVWQSGNGPAYLTVFADVLVNKDANRYAADFFRKKVREIIKDPVLAEQMMPTGFPIGTKRMCLGINYYETFLRSNVTLVDIRNQPITKITEHGVCVADTEYCVDSLVFATGFDAMTGALSKIDIRNRQFSLADKWDGSARTYLGLATAGFPNLFFVTGPGSPSVLSNVVVSIEQHVDWITDCLKHLRSEGMETIEASETAETEWVEHVNAVANQTLFPLANSWYLGANVPGKPRVFLPYVGGVGVYRAKCTEVARAGYVGFELDAKGQTAIKEISNV
jgi:cyclohexanone monooxygenase